MTIEQREHVLSWLERAVILVSMLYLAAHTLPAAWKTLNTDFPNYYMSAQLVHDGYDPARMYDWSWIEREKDHRALDIRVIGLLPITPFSTLAILPAAKLAPLAAKHVWILLSLTLLIPIVWMLRSMTGLSCQRIVLVFALCFPLHRNLEFGQYYIVLLLLIVAACWSYLRGWRAMAGALVAVAAACKVFPILFLLFFLRRRAWRALSWTLATGLVIATLSIAIFGWDVHRTYLQEILPWTLHGEAMPPYVASASISGVLHRLFLSEPQWNPHPWHSSPLWFALLMPSLQMLALAPAILLVRKGDVSRTRTLLEWSAILTASLATSTVPALYNFVLMTLPVCVLAAALLEAGRYRWIPPLLIVFLCIGLPLPSAEKLSGALALLQVARLPLILVLLAGIYWLLWNDPANEGIERDSTTYVWAIAISITIVVSVFSTFYRERSMRLEYAYRLPLQEQGFLNAHPHPAGSGVRYVAFSYTGYHLVMEDQNKIQTAALTELPDDLSFTNVRDTNGEETIYAERAVIPRSQIVDISHGSQVVVEDAREPMLSADGKDLAFIRDDHGRGRLVERPAFAEAGSRERPLTLSLWNVYEASFRSDREYAFSAVSNGRAPEVYLTDATHTNSPLNLGESRYPAISPDGRWMAYSKFEGNGWNLWLRDQRIGTTRRIADVPCNQIQPMWEEDSRALLYSTDCGRSLWFTAIARRTVVP